MTHQKHNDPRHSRDITRRSLLPVTTQEAAQEVAGASSGSDAPTLTWGRALDAWKLRLRSAQTCVTYLSAVRHFARLLGDPLTTPLSGSFTVETLDAYAGALAYRADRDAPPRDRLSPATVNLKLAALRSFLTFARRRGWLPPAVTGEVISDALSGIRATVQRPYQIVEGNEQDALLDAAEASETFNAARASALVGLALGAGLRVAELCALDVGDLASDATSCYVDVRQGKGRKDRQVPISDEVYAQVLAYLGATSRAVWSTADRATPLFLSRNVRDGNGRLSTRQAERIVRACATRAGLSERGKRITPHSLRHSYAIDVLRGDAANGRAGAPLPAVTKLLGHSSVAVTGRYLAHFERGELANYAPKLRRGAQTKEGE